MQEIFALGVGDDAVSWDAAEFLRVSVGRPPSQQHVSAIDLAGCGVEAIAPTRQYEAQSVPDNPVFRARRVDPALGAVFPEQRFEWPLTVLRIVYHTNAVDESFPMGRLEYDIVPPIDVELADPDWIDCAEYKGKRYNKERAAPLDRGLVTFVYLTYY